MLEILMEELYSEQYKPVLVLLCLCKNNVYIGCFQVHICKDVALTHRPHEDIDKKLWGSVTVVLLCRLEATELVTDSPFFHVTLSTKIKWLEWHTNRRKSMTEISSCSLPLLRKCSEYHHYLPGFIRMSDPYRVIWNVDHVCIFYFIYCMTSNICHFSSFCY